MTEFSGAELAKIMRDLLRIAKVAMPPKVFGEDPRVTTATAVLETLEGRALGRVPNVTSRPPKLDIARLAQRRAVEESAAGITFTVELPWDLVEAMDHDARYSSRSFRRDGIYRTRLAGLSGIASYCSGKIKLTDS